MIARFFLSIVLVLISGLALGKEDSRLFQLGESYVVRPGDVLADIARAHDLGYVELLAANPGVDPWFPKPGRSLVLPTTHIAPSELPAGIVVNLGDMRLYYTNARGETRTFPMGIGQDGYVLKPGVHHVANKRVHPTWVPPPSVRKDKPWLPISVPPGPDNPLGEYSLDLDFGLVRIHGTNNPDGVGRRVSRGCFRMYPEDIATLFSLVGVGTPVTVINQPAKLGWIDGDLWLEVHPAGDQADAVEFRVTMPVRKVPGLKAQVTAVAGSQASQVDWQAVEWAETHRNGMPIRILRGGQAAQANH